MDNETPVQPLQNPGDQPQPNVLERVFGRHETQVDAPGGNIFLGGDNVTRVDFTECVNPSCSSFGKALDESGTCKVCGYNDKDRF